MEAPREFRQHRYVPPAGACEILFVRHGESAAAVEGSLFPLVDGHGDPSLAPDGVLQAKAAAKRLVEADEAISAIYVSSLQRTHQTAAPLAAALGMTPTVEADLREVFLGEWEGGLIRTRIADGDPIVSQMHLQQRWDVIPGSEPAADFRERVQGAVSRIATVNPDRLVVAFAHGGVIGEAMNIASHATGLRFSGAANGSITHLVVNGDEWTVRCFNDTSHLGVRFSGSDSDL